MAKSKKAERTLTRTERAIADREARTREALAQRGQPAEEPVEKSEKAE